MRTKTKRPGRRTTPRRETLADQFRAFIAESGYSTSALAEAAELDPSGIGRFLRSERSLTLDSAEPLARVLGIEFIQRGKVKPRSVS
jgi:plasmid maintenance system antidote protein VapI